MKDKETGGKEKQTKMKNSGQKTSTDQDTKDTRKSDNDSKKEQRSESKKTKERGDGDKAKREASQFKKVRVVEVNADGTAESSNGQYKLNMKDQGILLNQSVEWILTLCKQNKV